MPLTSKDLQHRMWLIQHNGLFTAPIASIPDMRVVDIGCGTGIWAIGFATQYPETHVTGVDITMPHPKSAPANCHFEVGDAEGDWSFASGPLDLIYGRMLVNSIRNWPTFLRTCLQHLKPGGWCEFSDVAHRFFAEDGCSESESPMMRWWRLVFQESSKSNGVDIDDSYRHAEQMRIAGFHDVRERVFKWHVGGANGANEKERAIGDLLKENLQVLIDGVTSTALNHGDIRHMSDETVEQMAKEAKRDISENAERHGYYMHFVTYIGQAPI